MKITLEITPRQTGKTERTINEFLESYEKCAIVGIDRDHCLHIVKRINRKMSAGWHHDKQVISSQALHHTLLTNKITKVFLDEYLFFSSKYKKEVYEVLRNERNVQEVVIRTSSDKLYPKELLDFVRYMKELGASPDKLKSMMTFGKKNFDDAWYNFLTDPEANIVNHKRDYFGYSEERYATEVEGKYLI